MLINQIISQRIVNGNQATETHCSQFKAVARTTDESDGEMRCLSYNYWILSNVMEK